MSREAKPHRTNVHLTFLPTAPGASLVCNLTRLFDLDFNISTAQITPRQEGFPTLELLDSRDACDKGIGYSREEGVLVSLVVRRIWHNEGKCTQCGICTALCPSSVPIVDIKARLLAFDKEEYTVCARCTHICPVGAVQMDAPEEGALIE